MKDHLQRIVKLSEALCDVRGREAGGFVKFPQWVINLVFPPERVKDQVLLILRKWG